MASELLQTKVINPNRLILPLNTMHEYIMLKFAIWLFFCRMINKFMFEKGQINLNFIKILIFSSPYLENNVKNII